MKVTTRAGLGALALTLVATASACGSSGASEGGACEGKVGVMGALSGPNASIVLPSVDGAKLALEQWEAEPGNKDCEIEIVEFDTEGYPAKATPFATEMADDDSFLGVLGGASSDESRATMAIFGDAGLTMVSQSASATDLTRENPSPVFHRVVGYNDIQGAAIATYLRESLDATKIFVIDNSDSYGAPLAAKVSSELGGLVVASDTTQVTQTDFSSTVAKIKALKPDAIFFAGYIAEAAGLLSQLRGAGIVAPFVGGDGLYSTEFGKATGANGAGTIITCLCAPIEDEAFVADFEAATGSVPGPYAAEGYDAMNVFLDAFADGARTREEVEAFVDDYDAEGLTKHITFDENGDVAVESVAVWAYEVKNGKLVPDQEISPS